MSLHRDPLLTTKITTRLQEGGLSSPKPCCPGVGRSKPKPEPHCPRPGGAGNGGAKLKPQGFSPRQGAYKLWAGGAELRSWLRSFKIKDTGGMHIKTHTPRALYTVTRVYLQHIPTGINPSKNYLCCDAYRLLLSGVG